MFAGAVGGVWHKYFTKVGISRYADFHKYISKHWYFWLVFLAGLLLVWVGGRGHSTKTSSEAPPSSP
jgi:hypothetical protein